MATNAEMETIHRAGKAMAEQAFLLLVERNGGKAEFTLEEIDTGPVGKMLMVEIQDDFINGSKKFVFTVKKK